MPSSISIHSQAARPAGRNAGKGDLQVGKLDKTPGTGIAGPRSSRQLMRLRGNATASRSGYQSAKRQLVALALRGRSGWAGSHRRPTGHDMRPISPFSIWHEMSRVSLSRGNQIGKCFCSLRIHYDWYQSGLRDHRLTL